MSTVFDIAVPCAVIPVRVTIGPPGTMTPLERLVLRAIAAGEDTYDQLTEFFGLNPRLMLDLIHGLWTAGHVVVSFSSGQVALTGLGQRACSDDDVGSVRSTVSRIEQWSVLHEPVTGKLLPSTNSRALRPGAIALPPAALGDVDDLPSERLIGALQRIVERQRRSGFCQRVLSVSRLNPERSPSLREWLHLSATATEDMESGRISVQVVSDGKLTRSEETRLGQYVADLVERDPKATWSGAITGRAQKSFVAPERVADILDRLDKAIDHMIALPTDQVGLKDDQLADLGTRVVAGLESQAGRRCHIEIVAGAEANQQALFDLARRAEQQLVVATPFLSRTGLVPFIGCLDEALGRGVTVILLWGIDASSTLPPAVATALAELRRKFGDRLVYSPDSSRSHVKLVVRDWAEGLVTSANVLTGGQSLEVGLRISQPAERVDAIEDLLEWSRKRYPDARERGRIRYRESSDQSVGRSPEGSGLIPSPPARLVDPSAIDPTSHRLWEESWRSFAAGCRALIEDEANPVVELVEDGRHRELLMNALRTARDRLVVSSDQLSSKVVGPRFLHRLAGLAEAGVSIDLVYRRLAEADQSNPDNPVTALEALAEGGEAVALTQTDSHAKVLVVDRTVVVSSFNFLSVEGLENIGGLRRPRELGLEVQSAELSDRVAKIVGARPVTVAPAGSPATGQPMAHQAFQLHQRARSATDLVGFAAEVRIGIEEVSDPYGVLKAWAGAIDDQLPTGPSAKDDTAKQRIQAENELQVAAAIVLSRFDDPERQTDRLVWTDWLARRAVADGRYTEAALIHAASPDLEPMSPSRHLIRLSTVLDMVPIGDLVGDSAIGLQLFGHQDELATGAALALTELLFGGSLGGRAAVETLAEELPPAWREVADAALRYYGLTFKPLPIDRIRESETNWQTATGIDAGWETSLQKLEDLERKRTRWNFKSGAAAHRTLFAVDGELGRLIVAVRNRSADDLRDALALIPDDLQKLINSTTDRLGVERIKFNRLQGFLNELDRAMSAVLTLGADLQHADVAIDGSDEAAVVDVCNLVAQHWDDLSDPAGFRIEGIGTTIHSRVLERLELLAAAGRLFSDGGRQ